MVTTTAVETTISPTATFRARHTAGALAAVALLVAVDATAMTAAIARFGKVTPNTFILVALAVWFIAMKDHYRPRLQLSVLDDLPSIAGRVVVAVSLGAAYRELVSGHDVFTVDRLWVLVGAVVFVLIGRSGAYLVLRLARLAGLLRRRTIVIGSDETAREVNEAILANPTCGLTPVAEPVQFPVSRAWIEQLDVDVVIAEVTDSTDAAVADLVRDHSRSGPEIYLLPAILTRYPAVVPGADQLASLPLLPLRQPVNRSLRWKLKRVIDVILAVALIVVLAPVMALCALILRIEGGSGVLFRQERVGLGGRRFTMLKLRTIVAEQSEADEVWNVRPEEISAFARFCRATSLDELPQLWNVIRGDMSLVGPRPERPHFVDQFSESIPEYESRHRVPAGLTGLAQVHGLRGDTSIRLRARFDNNYIDNWSLFQDIKIIARTVSSMMTRRGRGS
ncbi:MAG: exopolysaccharide biosynthesis polyprenyl glycosylphosphotransferase [Acidimicrobiales bacterium]